MSNSILTLFKSIINIKFTKLFPSLFLSKDEKIIFWELSLYYSSSGVILILSVNSIVLATVCLVVFTLISSPEDVAYKSLLSNLLGWLFNSMLCLFILVVMKLLPSKVIEITGKSLPEVWEHTGYYLLLQRFLSLLSRAYNEILNHQPTCYSIGAPGIQNFLLPTYFLLLDVSQVLMAFAPFTLPLPWSTIFIVIEMCSLLLRLQSCIDQIQYPQRWDSAAAYSISFVCMLFIILRCFLFELNAKNLFKENRLLLEASQSKHLFVDFLCKDMKIPLQLISGTIEHMKQLELKCIDAEVDHLIQQMLRSSYQVTLLADNLLSLTRIEEGRFQFQFNQEINLNEFFTSHLKKPFVSVMTGNVKLITKIDNTPLSAALTDSSALSILTNNALCFSANMLRERLSLSLPVDFQPKITITVTRHEESNESVGDEVADRNRSLDNRPLFSSNNGNRTNTQGRRSSPRLPSNNPSIDMNCIDIHWMEITIKHNGIWKDDHPTCSNGLQFPKDSDGASAVTNLINSTRVHVGDAAIHPQSQAQDRGHPEATPNPSPAFTASTLLTTVWEVVVKGCNGSMSVSRCTESDGEECTKIVLLVPYKVLLRPEGDMPHTESALSPGNNPTTLLVPTPTEIRFVSRSKKSDKNRLGNSVMKNANRKFTAGYLVDDENLLRPAFKTFADEAVICTPLNGNLSGLEALSSGASSIVASYDMLLLGSMSLCLQVRSNFKGTLVMMSGNATYLDNNTEAFCDYILPIPYRKEDICNICKLIQQSAVSKGQLEEGPPNRAPPSDAAKTSKRKYPLLGQFPSYASSYNRTNYGLGDANSKHSSLNVNDPKHDQLQLVNRMQRFFKWYRKLQTNYWNATLVYPVVVRVADNVGSVSSCIRRGVSAMIHARQNFEGLNMSLGQMYNFNNYRWGMPMFSSEVEESLLSWILVDQDDSFSLFHHSTTMNLNSMALLVQYVLSVLFGSRCWWYHEVVVLLVLAMLFRKPIRRYLGIRLLVYWRAIAVIVCFWTVLENLLFFVDWRSYTPSINYHSQFTDTSSASERNSYAISFADRVFGSYTGKYLLGLLIVLYVYSSGMWEVYFPWPWSVGVTAAVITKSWVILIIAGPVFPRDMYVIAWMIFTQACVTMVLNMYRSAIHFRLEFQNIQKKNFSVWFLGRCTTMCCHDLVEPLHSLLKNHSQFLTKLHDSLSSRQILPSESFADNLMVLHMGHTLLGELSEELNLLQKLDGKKAEMSVTDVVFIEKEMLEVAKIFDCYYSHRIEVFVMVDPTLSLIRVDAAILRTLLVNAVSLACRNITQKFQESPSSRDRVQEVLVRAKAVLSVGSFTEKKRFEIEVLDSGSSTLVTGQKVLGYGHDICKRVVEFNGGVYEVIPLGHYKYNTKLKFSLPYHLHRTSNIYSKVLAAQGLVRAERKNYSLLATYRSLHANDVDLKQKKIVLIDAHSPSLWTNAFILERNGWKCWKLEDLTALTTFRFLEAMDAVLLVVDVTDKLLIESVSTALCSTMRALRSDKAVFLMPRSKSAVIREDSLHLLGPAASLSDCVLLKPLSKCIDLLPGLVSSRTFNQLLWRSASDRDRDRDKTSAVSNSH